MDVKHDPVTLQESRGLNESTYNTGASLDLPRPGKQMAVEKWIRVLQKHLKKRKVKYQLGPKVGKR